MKHWPDDISTFDEGKMYSWYFDVDGIPHDFHQESDGPVIVLVQNDEEELVEVDLGGLTVAEWLKSKNIQLLH